MNTFLHAKFKFATRRYISTCQNITVGLSSGQDSLCLLKLLVDCLDTSRQKINIVYIDHQWKNRSKQHAQHVINISKFMKLPVTIYQITALTVSENEARKIRYKMLMQHALRMKCDTIILGHNSDDHAETIMSNFLRGASLDGIANFAINKQVNSSLSIVRPLIHFSKAEIGWLCRLLCMPIWSDETNYNLGLKRNRIRHELLPYIQNFFNPKIKQALTAFSHLCNLENEYIKENTIKLYYKSMHNQLLSINLNHLLQQHEVLSKRTLRLYFYYNFNVQINNGTTEWILGQKKSEKLNAIRVNRLRVYKMSQWLYACTADSALKLNRKSINK